MKIGQTEPVSSLPPLAASATPAASQAAKPPAPTPIAPTPIVPTLAFEISVAKTTTEENRLARIQELANQISQGQYQPIPAKVASAILDEAAIDARLEAAGLRENP